MIEIAQVLILLCLETIRWGLANKNSFDSNKICFDMCIARVSKQVFHLRNCILARQLVHTAYLSVNRTLVPVGECENIIQVEAKMRICC